MKTKKELERTIDILEREKFLDVYSQFDLWLKNLGFKAASFKISGTNMDCHYSYYNEYIDSLYSVEHYVHDILNLSVRFLRDRHEHKFMFVGPAFTFSEVCSLEETKLEILDNVKSLKRVKLEELNGLVNV